MIGNPHIMSHRASTGLQEEDRRDALSGVLTVLNSPSATEHETWAAKRKSTWNTVAFRVHLWEEETATITAFT